MAVVEFERVEVDLCLSCMGLWLDGSELDLLVQRVGMHLTGLEKSILKRAKGGRRGRKRCPLCRKRMREVMESSITLDICPSGEGLWFDRGELKALLTLKGEQAPLPILSKFFGGFFPGDAVKNGEG